MSFAAHVSDVSVADKTDLGLLVFADAASFSKRGTEIAAARQISPDRSLVVEFWSKPELHFRRNPKRSSLAASLRSWIFK
jgi:hypothetical protein